MRTRFVISDRANAARMLARSREVRGRCIFGATLSRDLLSEAELERRKLDVACSRAEGPRMRRQLLECLTGELTLTAFEEDDDHVLEGVLRAPNGSWSPI